VKKQLGTYVEGELEKMMRWEYVGGSCPNLLVFGCGNKAIWEFNVKKIVVSVSRYS